MAKPILFTLFLFLTVICFCPGVISHQTTCKRLDDVYQAICEDEADELSPTTECANKWLSKPADYMYMGCYSEELPWAGNRVVGTVENQFPTVTGNYKARENAIAKCARIAKCMGYKVFVVQDGGWCATSADAHRVYGKYGSSTKCAQNGKGGPGTNSVYTII